MNQVALIRVALFGVMAEALKWLWGGVIFLFLVSLALSFLILLAFGVIYVIHELFGDKSPKFIKQMFEEECNEV